MKAFAVRRRLATIGAIGLAQFGQGATFAVSTGIDVEAQPAWDLVGTRFRVGSAPLLVSDLGGYDLNRDGPVDVGIWGSDGVAIASSSLIYTAINGYVFAPLASPVLLLPGLEYVVTLQGSARGYGTGYRVSGANAVDSFGPGLLPLADVWYLEVSSPNPGLIGDYEWIPGKIAGPNFKYAVVPELESHVVVAATLLVGLAVVRRMPRRR
jgi:hypothetical protein